MVQRPESTFRGSKMQNEGIECGFCHAGEEAVSTCGRLFTRKGIAAHRKCMQYSAMLAQYECTTFGGFDIDEVKKEIMRGSKLKCNQCKHQKSIPTQAVGATAGCAWQACRKSFHFLCARQSVVTRRLILTDPRGRENVLYRVFCKKDHQDLFIKKYCADLDVLYTEDSDENWDAESDPETESTTHRLDTSSSPTGLDYYKKKDHNKDKEKTVDNKKQTKPDQTENSKTAKVRKETPKMKMKPTKRDPQPPMFESAVSSEDESGKENENSLTESEEADLSKRRYTRNQMQVVEAKMPGCLTPDRNRVERQATTCSPRFSKRDTERHTGKVGVDSATVSQGKPTSQLSPGKGNNKTSITRSPPRKNRQNVTTQSELPKRSSPRQQKSAEKLETSKPVHSNDDNTSILDASRSRRVVVHPVEEPTKVSPPKSEKKTLDGKSLKRSHSGSDGPSKISKVDAVALDGSGDWKDVKSEKPIGREMESQTEDLKDAFVICILEDKYCTKSDTLHITRLVQKQFVVAEHRLTRWKYGGDEDLNHDQMLYLMRDITKALVDKDHSEVYRLMFELGRKDLDFYQNHIDFNQSLGDLNLVLENKLREKIVENLTIAQERYGKRIGCVINMSETAIMLVLLINDYVDGEFRIRTKLGHSFSTHKWDKSTFAKDLSQFAADVVQYFSDLELQNLNELLESKMKDSVFELFVKPSDALLQLKKTGRVSERIRYFLRLKRKKMDCGAAQTNILFIGPLDTSCLNTKGYCQKCIPMFIEENLTALKDVFVVVDLSVGCGIHGIEDLFSHCKLPPQTETQIWSAFNPAIVPVTCAIAHFRVL